MAFRVSDVIGLIWHHPIVSIVVVLLFTPPLFPIVVYFSPLLISTALVVLAMISMGSDHENTPNYSNDIPYKRVWIEEVDVDGPNLDGERVPKRLKATSKDESWFNKVKNWEGTGRAWVESVLSQEARKSFGSDDNAVSRDESIPLLDKARGYFIEDVRQRSREAEDEQPKFSSRPVDEAQTVVGANDSAPDVSVEKLNAVPLDKGKSSSEITPELESEDELIEIAPANIPPSPLFRSKLLPKADEPVHVAAEVPKAGDAVSEAPSKTVESVGTVPGTDSTDGKNSAFGSDSTNVRNSIPPVVERKVVERAPADVQNSSNSAEVASPSDGAVGMESNLIPKETAQISSEENKPEVKAAVSSGVSSTVGADRNPAEKVQTNVTTEGGNGTSGAQSTETKSAGELLAPLTQNQASYGLGTPSAAVALSEKLNVPLADIMSLLAGDDKEHVPNEGPSGVKVSTSSETTTTSQEEDWSSSDLDSPAPQASVGGPSSVKDNA